jgi:hypothetical protein
MKMPRRVSLVILLLALIVLMGIVFRTLVFNVFVLPVAALCWLLWRLLLSVDQDIYWELLIFTALIYVIFRLTKVSAGTTHTAASDPNTALETVNYWRTSIMVTHNEIERPNLLKSNLGRLLAAVYARQQPERPLYEVYSALSRREIQMPESINNFLFPQELPASAGGIRQLLNVIRQAPTRWYRQRTGRDVMEYYQSIEEVIALMESSMEVNDGDEHANNNKS